jgi:hypothetical protein
MSTEKIIQCLVNQCQKNHSVSDLELSIKDYKKLKL